MSYEDKDEDQRWVLGILATLVSLIVAGILIFCAWMSSGSDGATGAGSAGKAISAAGVGTQSNTGAADEARVVVENGVVKFYFATGQATLATGANEALVEVVKGVKAGQRAVISGYHDSTGNLEKNQELAKQRASSVRDTLVVLGVSDDRIELKKPENSTGTGGNAEARRVEVVLAK